MTRFLNALLLIIVLAICSCSKGKNDSTILANPPPGDTAIHVTGLAISTGSSLMLPGYTKQLTVAITPYNATNNALSWSSSNEGAVKVDKNGFVTALAEGSAIITVTSVDKPSITASVEFDVLKRYNVYAVGEEAGLAYFWKNDVPSKLVGGYNVGITASSIAVIGGDVYIAGTTLNNSLWPVVTLWKNGVATQLSNPSNEFMYFATGLAISGSNAYVSGYSFRDTSAPNYFQNIYNAYYWKVNGSSVTEYPLVISNSSTTATGIAASENNVFVAGTQHDNNSYTIGKYWKGTVADSINLTRRTVSGQTTAIAMNGSDVYITGYDGCGDFGCNATAELWKNNMQNATLLTDGSFDAEALNLCISGNDIYVTGYETNIKDKKVAKYWKINREGVTSFELSDGEFDAYGRCIAVVGDDVFVGGAEKNKDNVKEPKYWRVYKNLVLPINLSLYDNTSGYDSRINAIVVK